MSSADREKLHIVDKSVTGPSKILTRKWREKDLTRHKQKLADMRPVVTNHPSPPVFINKLKNEQIVEDRFTEIERENRILFEKITQIHLKGLAGPGKISNLLHHSEFKDRHFIDSVSATISGSNSARKLSTIQSNSGKPGEA